MLLGPLGSSSSICGVLANAAGDIASSGGLGDGTPFGIGIADPFAPLRLAEIVELTGAIATSGTYERGEHLIAPGVADLDRAPAFYRDGLGFGPKA